MSLRFAVENGLAAVARLNRRLEAEGGRTKGYIRTVM
jgi:hypothetical protein